MKVILMKKSRIGNKHLIESEKSWKTWLRSFRNWMRYRDERNI